MKSNPGCLSYLANEQRNRRTIGDERNSPPRLAEVTIDVSDSSVQRHFKTQSDHPVAVLMTYNLTSNDVRPLYELPYHTQDL